MIYTDDLEKKSGEVMQQQIVAKYSEDSLYDFYTT